MTDWIRDGLLGRSAIATFRLYRIAVTALVPIIWSFEHIYGDGPATMWAPWLVTCFVGLELLLASRPSRRADKAIEAPPIPRRRSDWIDELSTFSLDALALCGAVWATSRVIDMSSFAWVAPRLRDFTPLVAVFLAGGYLYLRLIVFDRMFSPAICYQTLSQYLTRSVVHTLFDPMRSAIPWVTALAFGGLTTLLARGVLRMHCCRCSA